MNLNKINDFIRYQAIVEKYKRKDCLSNDYLYQEAAGLITQGRLFEYSGTNNAFLFVKKDGCLRMYYYLNDLEETSIFDLDYDVVVEILFRGSNGIPEEELSYLSKCGFQLNLRRDQYCGIYKDLQSSGHNPDITVQKAKSLSEVTMACELFNNSFDHYSGDYVSKEMYESLFTEGSILVAKNLEGNFAGALHQTIEHNVAWISHVAVMESFRGKGVGQALLSTFVEQNKVNEKSRYMLWVQAQNYAAVRMYHKKGFKYMNKSTISMLKLK